MGKNHASQYANFGSLLAKRYSLTASIFFSCQNFVDSKIRIIFAYEFIPHLREGNRKTQAIEALRFLLL